MKKSKKRGPKLKPIAERFWSKVKKSGDCLEWTGRKLPAGYGGFYLSPGKEVLAHRMAWYLEYGEWPEETIDHLCGNTSCVWVSHLEDVSLKENISRSLKDECSLGHPYSGTNLLMDSGYRRCRECRRVSCKQRYARQKALRITERNELVARQKAAEEGAS